MVISDGPVASAGVGPTGTAGSCTGVTRAAQVGCVYRYAMNKEVVGVNRDR